MNKQMIRKNLKLNITGDLTPPFLPLFYSDKINIQFSSNEPVSIFDDSKSFYDCFQIKTHQEATINVLIPLTDTLYISDQHGNKWILRLEYERTRISTIFNDFILYYQSLLKGMTASMFYHIGLILMFSLLYYASQQSEAIKSFVGLKSQSIKLIQANLEAVASRETVPFSGMSLREYVQTYIDNKAPVDKVKSAVNSLAKISGIFNKSLLQGISGKLMDKDTGSNLPKLDTKNLIAESLKDIRSKEIATASRSKAIIPNSPIIPSIQYDKKEMLIKSLLQSLRAKFSQNFDEALQIDPTLSIVIVYEASIDSNGKLSKIKLTTKGNGSTLAIETLKKKVEKTFESLHFPPDYSGTPIHGEQVFIK
jgi:hypothetical protein